MHALVNELIIDTVEEFREQASGWGLMNKELDKLLCAKRVLLRSFFNSLISAMTIQKVLSLGPKTKALLKNLMELR